MNEPQASSVQSFGFAEPVWAKQQGLWSQAFSRLIRNRLAVAAGIVLVVLITVSLAGQVLEPIQRHDPALQDYANVNATPSAEHPLGTDILGRDLWARMIDATLFSLKIGIGAEAVILVIGVTLGMTAALGGRLTDTIISWVTDLAFAFPDLLAIILFRQVLAGRDWPIIGSGDPQVPGFPGPLFATLLAISFVSWVTICRLVRGQMLSIKHNDYVMAAESIGASRWRIVRVHMLPNALSTVIVAVTFGIPTRIFAEASLGFLGLGVPPPAASLGTLINDGYDNLFANNLLVVWPALMVAALMLCFTFFGDGLRDALDPRTRK